METETARELFRSYLYRRYGDRSTPKHYLSDLAIFLAFLGEKPVTTVNAKDIDSFVDQQHAQKLAPATVNRRLATLRTFFLSVWQPKSQIDRGPIQSTGEDMA